MRFERPRVRTRAAYLPLERRHSPQMALHCAWLTLFAAARELGFQLVFCVGLLACLGLLVVILFWVLRAVVGGLAGS